MTWRWIVAAGEGPERPVGQTFESQELAESWLTESYEDLLDDGYTHASLYEGDRLVYGPMTLTA